MAWLFEPGKEPVIVRRLRLPTYLVGTWVCTRKGWFFKSAPSGLHFEKTWVSRNEEDVPGKLKLEILLRGADHGATRW